VFAQADGPQVAAVGDELHVLDLPGVEEGQEPIPVVGRAVAQAEAGGVGGVDRRLAASGGLAQPGRRHSILGAKGVVEAAQAGKAAGKGDLRHR